MAQTSAPLSETERFAHYHDLAAQFRTWAEAETKDETRAGLLDMARQYERLAAEVTARIDAVLAKRG